MEYFQYRYYRIVEAMLTVVGLWPNQSAWHSSGFVLFCLLVFCSLFIPQVTAAVKNRDDFVIVLEGALALIVTVILITKGVCSKSNEQKIFELLNRIHTDWRVWDLHPEVDILHKYAEQGRKLILFGTVGFYSMVFVYTGHPMLLKIMDMLLKNGSRPGEFPLPIDYHYFDKQKYYFYIYTHILVSVFVGVLAAGPFAALLVVSVQHGCGIFAAVGHKLNAIGQDENVVKNKAGKYELDEKDVEFEEIVWCIKRHNEAIAYANLIESTFSWGFLFTLGMHMLVISVAGYQIVKGSNKAIDTARFVISIVSALTDLSVECYFAQILTDHSISISRSIYNSKWYEQTSKVRNLLYFMICCNEPSTLTAGNIFIMNLHTLAEVLKTSISCLTVLRSM